MVKYRLNVLNINSITDFGRIRGKKAGEIQDVYIVKFVGSDADIHESIKELKKILKTERDLGRVYYKYIDNLYIGEGLQEYQKIYDDWISGGKNRIDMDLIKTNKISMTNLLNALGEMERLLYKYKQNISPSIVKNIMIKLLYWLGEKFEQDNIRIGEDRNIKIICENIIKESQVYFFVFLNLLGMDVCMLQYGRDFDIMSDYFHIKKLGDFSGEESIWKKIPEDNPRKIEDRGVLNRDKVSNAEVNSNVSVQPVTISMASIRRADRDNKNRQSSREKKTLSPSANSQAGGMVSGGEAISAASTQELSYVELAKLSISIVMIAIYDKSRKMVGTGSGIMLGKDGFILTNCHVISGGYFFEVRIEDDEMTYKTDEVIKYNQHLDLAVIRIQRTLKPLKLYDGSKKLERGQKVVAIGSPLGLFNSVSDGIISGFRNIERVDMIQFSAPISPGSSGGAVLNMYGELIGISTAGLSEGQNINLAVPYEAIKDFARGFISH